MSSRDEFIARNFHEAYEHFAHQYSYTTRAASAKPWDEIPQNNRDLMVAVVHYLVRAEIIEPGPKTRQQVSVLGEPTALERKLQDRAREV